jgi:hypothetical protein
MSASSGSPLATVRCGTIDEYKPRKGG